jgi:hypothetical protein
METTHENMEAAKKELEAICHKYQVSLVPVVVHHGERTFTSVEIVPVQKPAELASETAI